MKTLRKELRAQPPLLRAFTLALGAVCAAQFLFLCWACLTQWQNHLDGDSSTQILKVMEIARAGSFSLRNWNDTTSLLLDTPLTLAALLMPLFRDAFVAYGVADILNCGLFCLAIWGLLRAAGSPLWGRLLALLLLLCPYERGTGLSYANCVLLQSGHYTVRILCFLYLLYGMALLAERRAAMPVRRRVYTLAVCLFGLFLTLLTGVSSGTFMLMLILLPILFFCLLYLLASRRYDALRAPALLLALHLVCALAGCWVQRNVIHFNSRDSTICWIGYDAFWKNLGAIVQGYFKLMGAMPAGSNVSILSLDGIFYAAGYAVALVLPCAAVLCLGDLFRHRDTAGAPLTPRALLRGACLLVAGFDLFVFASSALTYGKATYEVRYLIFGVIALVLLLCSYLPDLNGFGDAPGAFIGLFTLCAAINLAGSDASYLRPTYDFSYAQAVTQAIDEAFPEVQVVYMYSDDHDRKVLRVADHSKVYRLITGNYNPGDYTDGAGLESGTVLLCTEAQYAAMPPELSARYRRTDLPGYWLYLDATGYSTNDPQPYYIYHCPDGGIDLTSLPVAD